MRRLNLEGSKVYLVDNLKADLESLLENFNAEKIFLLTDESSYKYCFPRVSHINKISVDRTIIIKSGDNNKNIMTAVEVWKALSSKGADRKSILINLGGGMPTDLGGFAASTFKRGMKFINIPTTLLSMVDASVGGKTGINFEGFKNEIGVFNIAHAVLIDTSFLDTLDKENIKSGFAEMIKHTLIYSDESWTQLKSFNLLNLNLEDLKTLVADSISIKEHFVQADPTEMGIRKALNFGHTIGHAIESFALKSGKPLLHGYAVAYGMIAELYLSGKKLGFDAKQIDKISHTISQIYGAYMIDEKHDETLYELTLHDKKNEGGRINFTLLEAPGKVKIDVDCSKDDIKAALAYFRQHQSKLVNS